MRTMFKDKVKACDKAYALMCLLREIGDDEFVDRIIDCVKYDDEMELGTIRDNIVSEAYELQE